MNALKAVLCVRECIYSVCVCVFARACVLCKKVHYMYVSVRACFLRQRMHVYVCVRVCVRTCAYVCVRACVRECVCVCVCVWRERAEGRRMSSLRTP